MIDIKTLCPGCMQTHADPSTKCPHCGYSSDTSTVKNALPVFSILNGRYLLGCPLGKGGFGITYIAMDLPTERIVAVKEYFPADLACRADDNETVLPLSEEQKLYFSTGIKSFVKEGEILHRLLGIPGIVQYQDTLYCNNTAYLIMDYIPGISLKKQLKKQGTPFTEQQALSMMRPILEALQIMHQKQLLHRDISPENLMYRPDHTLTLIDFGAAREFSTDDDENLTVILKRGYAPEEQYHSGSRQGPWTDVYAVCAVFYHMLTGKLPQEAQKRATHDDLTPLSQLPELSISRSTCQALEKGLQVDALERYASIKDLMKDLYVASADTDSPFKPCTDTTASQPEKATIPSDPTPDITPGHHTETGMSTTGSHAPESSRNQNFFTEPGNDIQDNKEGIFSSLSILIVLVIIGGFCFFSLSMILKILTTQSSPAPSSSPSVSASNISHALAETLDSGTDNDMEQSHDIVFSETDTAVASTSSSDQETKVVIYRYLGSPQAEQYTYSSLTDALSYLDSCDTADSPVPVELRLLEDICEDIVIPASVRVEINLDGHTLKNISEHTITNYGYITLSEGTLDNISNEKAALCNMAGARADLFHMTVTRSAENGKRDADSADNSYYTIDNQGQLNITACKISNSGSCSSTIHNGTKSSDSTDNASLYITDAATEISGGLFVIKNEPNGTTTINKGYFRSSYDSLIYTRGSLFIKGGSYSDAPSAIKYAGGTYEIGTDTYISTDKDVDSE